MTNKGKHASQTPGTFYRDLAIMIVGIILVGAAVFFLLYLFADEPATGPTTTSTTMASTTSSIGETSTTEGASTTTSTPETSSSTSVDVRSPGDVTVVVLNSMGLDGAASRKTTELAEAGYQTLTPGNYEPEQDPSRIWYREGYAPEAAVILEYLPGADVQPIPDESIGEGADVVLVLGTGYSE